MMADNTAIAITSHQIEQDLPQTATLLPPIITTANNTGKEQMNNEKSFDVMLRAIHLDVVQALEKAQNIATHDNNLEKQYRQVAEENSKLNVQLYRARREITRLQGQLAILQLTPSEIREQRYHHLLQQKKRQIHETQLENTLKGRNLQRLVSVMSYQARAQTVNARGQYIDPLQKQHRRLKTFPLASTPAARTLNKGSLPPVLPGCHCSVCCGQQSLGATCLKEKVPSSSTKSGQQILLGDRVIAQGNQLGIVKYIGKLEFDSLQRIFIGIQLDAPAGITDGTLRGRQYFQCSPAHGIFVLPHDILCVTGRKSLSSGTALPKAKIKAITPGSQTKSKPSTCTSVSPSNSPDELVIAEMTVDQELQKLLNEKQTIEDLTNPSVFNMAQRISQLKAHSSVTSDQKDDQKDSETVIAENSIQSEAPSSHHENETMNDNTVLVLNILQEKDLGHSGYVTIKELTSALTSDALKLTQKQVEKVISSLGLQGAEGRGIEYLSMASYIAENIAQLKTESY